MKERLLFALLVLGGLMLLVARAPSAPGSNGLAPGVWWEPAEPVAGSVLAIHYDVITRGVLPSGTNPVRIHIGNSNRQSILNPDPAMLWSPTEAAWDYIYSIPTSATSTEHRGPRRVSCRPGTCSSGTKAPTTPRTGSTPTST